MTLITPDADTVRTQRLIEDVQARIADLRDTLKAHAEGIETGGKFEETEAKKTLTEVGALISHCLKLESTIEACRQKNSDIARGGFAFCFDDARSEIGCKLNQLRKCGGAGPVSE